MDGGPQRLSDAGTAERSLDKTLNLAEETGEPPQSWPSQLGVTGKQQTLGSFPLSGPSEAENLQNSIQCSLRGAALGNEDTEGVQR